MHDLSNLESGILKIFLYFVVLDTSFIKLYVVNITNIILNNNLLASYNMIAKHVFRRSRKVKFENFLGTLNPTIVHQYIHGPLTLNTMSPALYSIASLLVFLVFFGSVFSMKQCGCSRFKILRQYFENDGFYGFFFKVSKLKGDLKLRGDLNLRRVHAMSYDHPRFSTPKRIHGSSTLMQCILS